MLISTALLIGCCALGQEELGSELKPPPDRRRPSMFRRPEKDSPPAQLAHADALAAAGRPGKALKQYRALVHEWHNTPEAARAQEAYARLYLKKGSYPRAFEEFEYLVKHFGGQFAYADVVEEQFRIALQVMTKRRAQWLGMPGFTSPGLALPYFEKVVANAPAGKRASEARFYIGVIHEQAGDFDEAASAFRTAYSRDSEGVFAMDARFRYAYCMNKIANSAPRDKELCRSAFSELAGFVRLYPRSAHVPTAEKLMDELRERLAAMYFEVALFYDRPAYKPRAALIAYGDFLRKFPSSDKAHAAKRRMSELEKEAEVNHEG